MGPKDKGPKATIFDPLMTSSVTRERWVVYLTINKPVQYLTGNTALVIKLERSNSLPYPSALAECSINFHLQWLYISPRHIDSKHITVSNEGNRNRMKYGAMLIDVGHIKLRTSTTDLVANTETHNSLNQAE